MSTKCVDFLLHRRAQGGMVQRESSPFVIRRTAYTIKGGRGFSCGSPPQSTTTFLFFCMHTRHVWNFVVVVDDGVGLLKQSIVREEIKMSIYFVVFGLYSPQLSPQTLVLKLSNDARE